MCVYDVAYANLYSKLCKGEIACGLYNVQYPAAGLQGHSQCSLTLHLPFLNEQAKFHGQNFIKQCLCI